MLTAFAMAVVLAASAPIRPIINHLTSRPSVRQAVPGAHVQAIASDAEGFLWFGTERGVVRYDGVEMKLIAASTQTSGVASALHIASNMRLWVGWRGERELGYVEGQEFHELDAPSTKHANAIVGIGEDVWVGSADGLTRIRGAEVKVNPLADLPRGAVNALWVTPEKALWIASSQGLFVATLEPKPSCKRVGALKDAIAIGQDWQGRLWASYDHALAVYVYAPTGESLFTFGPSNSQPRAFLRDPDPARGMWMAMDPGLWYVDENESPSLIDLKAELDPRFRSLAFDVEGSLWAGTASSGALLIEHQPSLRVLGAQATSSMFAFSLAQDSSQNIWASTIDGLTRLADDGRFSLAPYKSLNLPSDLRALAGGKAGVWVASVAKGVLRVEHPAKDTAVVKWVTPRGARLVYDAGGNRAWFAWAAGGLGFLESDTDIRDVTVPDGATVTAMGPGANATLLIGTAAGRVYRAVENRLEGGERPLNEGPMARVVAVADLSNGGPCASTVQGGLECFIGARQIHYGAAAGLTDAVIGSILQDDAGQVWLGTESGILNVRGMPHPSTPALQSHALGLGAGMLSAECTAALGTSALKLLDGSLLFTTTSGVVWLDPKRAALSSKQQVKVDAIVADGVHYSATKPKLQLPSHLRHLELRYTTPRFIANDRLTFRYKLEGQDSTWVAAGTGRVASYTNLHAGDYRFVVLSTDGETESRAAVAFFVARPFTSTWTFRGLVAAAIVFVAFAFRRSRIARRRAEVALVAEERQRLARDLHDTVEQSIVSVRLQLDAAMLRLGRASVRSRAALGHLERGAELLGLASAGMRSAILALRFSGSRRGLAVGLRAEAARLLRDTDVSFDLQVQTKLPTLPLDLEHQLVAIAKEALTNAIKNGHAKKIQVVLAVVSDELQMLIADDGTGFDQADPVPLGHFGLLGMHERAEKIGASLHVDSLPKQGTSVTVLLRNLTGRPTR